MKRLLSVSMLKISVVKSTSVSSEGVPAFLFFCRALAHGVGRFTSTSLRDAEVGALSESSVGASESRKAVAKKRVPKLKAGRGGFSEQELRGVEDTQISTATDAKTTVEGYAEGIRQRNATQTKGVGILTTENAAPEKTEEVASCTTTKSARKHLADVFGSLDLNTYKHEKQWKQTALKLLDQGIPLTYVFSMLRKCRKLACPSVWVDSSLKYFDLLGMSHREIGRAISKLPTILSVTDRMFTCKLEFFDSIGIDRHQLGKNGYLVVAAMTTNLSTLRENAAFWNDYMKDVHEKAYCTMMLSNPSILSYKLFQQKVAWLEAQEFDKKWFLKGSHVLSMDLPILISKAEMLEHLGIAGVRKRSWALIVLARIRIPDLQVRFNKLLAAGLSLHQAQRVVSSTPSVLSLTEQNVDAKIQYVLNVMNASLDMLSSSRRVWSYSLETRIKNRHDVIKRLQNLGALQRNVSLDYMIRMTEVYFNHRFVKKLQDVETKASMLAA